MLRILETPGLQTRPQKINFVCERFRQEGKIKQLEDLRDATKDLSHIDRSDIYYQLLLSYIKQEDIDKAVGLWTQLQEDDVAPTDQFLYTLGTFLKERNVEVPFAIPSYKAPVEQEAAAPAPVRPKPTNTSFFREAIKAGDVDKALEVKNSGVFLSINDQSLLIERLLQNERVNEATKIALEMINKNQFPTLKVFRFLLNKLSNNGVTDVLELIGTKLNADQKKLLSFDNRMCHANVLAGNSEAYLKNLENTIDNAKDEELRTISEQFPRGGVNAVLEKHPEMVETRE